MERQLNTLLLLGPGEFKPSFDHVETLSLVKGIEAYFPDLILSKESNQNILVWADHTIF